MRPLCCVLAGLVFAVALTNSASAAIVVDIDRSVQRMAVIVDGVPRYNWRVSTARRGYITPPGTYHPEMLARALVLAQILQFADAAFDFLLWRLRHPRQLRDFASRPPCLARLCAARSRQRCGPVRPRAARRHEHHHDRYSLALTSDRSPARRREEAKKILFSRAYKKEGDRRRPIPSHPPTLA